MTYLGAVAHLAWNGLTQIVRAPTHSRRAEARRHLARRWLLLTALGAVVILALMFVVDFGAITSMPARGTPALWPVRIFTDFGKSFYVLVALALFVLVTLLLAPLKGEAAGAGLIGLSRRAQFLFLAVLVPVEAGELIKGVVGRGRPFVGGSPNPFNYSHFAWTESYASLPSGHAITAFALAFAGSALWPRIAIPLWIYAVLIAASRVLLLAHHPSDVVAGAFVGILGAMVVRYWFAARRLVFRIDADGAIQSVGDTRLGS